jgi:rhodanese-related sulfurtransferase
MSVQRISAGEAKTMFRDTVGVALLDVREQEEFSRGHALRASCVPFSRLECMVETLVPCRRAVVILMDSGREDGANRAERAMERLRVMGYSRVRVVTGGMDAWRRANLVEVTGVGALSKGFGEYVEENSGTPCLTPEEAKVRLDGGGTVVLDVRPREEYRVMSIPGGINAPGCELLYRFADLVPDPATFVVVNCAGRTRSIIGAQTLINAGVPNKVAALKGGTMNWRLAGFSLDYGASLFSAMPSDAAAAFARERAAEVAKKSGIRFMSAATLENRKDGMHEHTLYIFDVRQPEEYTAGHLPGSRNVPGGQLIQAFDEYAAVRDARIVLVDDTEARAVMTAHWLKQMGIPDVHVLRGGIDAAECACERLERGNRPAGLSYVPEGVKRISPAELGGMLRDDSGRSNTLVINTGNSKEHRKGHIPGAAWVCRGYLPRVEAVAVGRNPVVITSDSEYHASLAAEDAGKLWAEADVRCLAGGTPAWSASGRPMEAGMPWALCAEDDVWYRPYQDPEASPEAMRGYFDWEFGLVERIRKDGDIVFSLFAAGK